jgi:hypothetical protein
MELIKKTENYSIFKKRSGRYCIANPKGQWILGADKVKVLVDEKLIKVEKAKPKAEPAPAEAPKA